MTFSEWMRDNLLNSWAGLITQDIDHIIFNNNLSSFVLLEEKNSYQAPINIGQAIIFKFLDSFLKLQQIATYNGSFLVYITKYKGNIYINPHLVKKDNSWAYIANIKNNKNINFREFFNYICYNQNKLKKDFYKQWWNNIVNTFINSLYDCKETPPKRPTRAQRTPYRGSYLQNICKNMKNINWIFINYCTGYFIILEEKNKSNGQYKPAPQKGKIINKINQLFEESNKINQFLPIKKQIKNPRSNATYKYIGYFLIEFDNLTPEDSQNIWLNHKIIDRDKLITFLNLDTPNSISIANNYNAKYKWWYYG